MAQRFVHLGEIVHVHHRQGVGTSETFGLAMFLLQHIFEGAQIQQARQVIGGGEVADPLYGALHSFDQRSENQRNGYAGREFAEQQHAELSAVDIHTRRDRSQEQTQHYDHGT